jgi:hypothetical protein
MPNARLFAALLALAVGAGTVRADDRKEDPAVAALKAALERQTKELEALRKRVEELENERTKLVVEKETALRNLLRAENAAKLAIASADEQKKKLEALAAQIRELKGPNAPAPRPREKSDLPLDLRGVVTQVEDVFVKLNIGRDAGLEHGTVLELIRTNGKNETISLGRVVITRSLYPKEAIGEFLPARKVPIAKLRPDELPRKGDTVRPMP